MQFSPFILCPPATIRGAVTLLLNMPPLAFVALERAAVQQRHPNTLTHEANPDPAATRGHRTQAALSLLGAT